MLSFFFLLILTILIFVNPLKLFIFLTLLASEEGLFSPYCLAFFLCFFVIFYFYFLLVLFARLFIRFRFRVRLFGLAFVWNLLRAFLPFLDCLVGIFNLFAILYFILFIFLKSTFRIYQTFLLIAFLFCWFLEGDFGFFLLVRTFFVYLDDVFIFYFFFFFFFNLFICDWL